VIALTKQLMSSEGDSETTTQSMTNSLEYNEISVTHHFEAGDICLAPLSEDGQYDLFIHSINYLLLINY
jgi:hypothetical protein